MQTGLALIVLTAYLIAVVIRHGWLPSISESYYHIRHKTLFTLVMWAMAMLVVSSRQWEYIYMPLACFGLLVVGVAPNFKTKGLANRLHFSGAIMALGFGMLALGFELGQWFTMSISLWLMLACYISLERNILYWIELVAFYVILFSLLFY